MSESLTAHCIHVLHSMVSFPFWSAVQIYRKNYNPLYSSFKVSRNALSKVHTMITNQALNTMMHCAVGENGWQAKDKREAWFESIRRPLQPDVAEVLNKWSYNVVYSGRHHCSFVVDFIYFPWQSNFHCLCAHISSWCMLCNITCCPKNKEFPICTFEWSD